MRRSLVPSLLTAALTALALAPATAAGQALVPEPPPTAAPTASAPALPAPVLVPPPPPTERTVPKQLAALRDAGLLTLEAHDRARSRYDAARAAVRRLTGRVGLAFETLERNRQWWTGRPLLGWGARVSFAGSELVWQSYPGQGIQVQWLASFGKANALFTGRTYDARLRALLAEALALAAPRAGGIAFESWFTFDGGRPPWVSSLGQGTAIQAFSRAGIRLADSAHLETARGGRESDLGYHRLLRDFSRGLCARTATPLYCDTAGRFTADLIRPPVLSLLPVATPARQGRSARVALTVDKVSTVSLTALRGPEVVYTRTARLPRGRHEVKLPKLRKAGVLALRLRAVDPAGNASVAAGRLAVSPSSRPARP